MAWDDQQVRDLIQQVRQSAEEGMVESRRQAEEDARQILNRSAGRMSAEEAMELGRLFNTGMWRGITYHTRFAPAFHGATMLRVVSDIQLFNSWTRQLWSTDEDEALNALDKIVKDKSVLPGAGRSYPSMLLYLRDQGRFAVWMNGTSRGLWTITGIPQFPRSQGRKGYESFCGAVRQFEHRFDLRPQETDAVLAAASRRRKKSPPPAPTPSPKPITSAAELAVRASLPVEEVETWIDLLRGSKKQALFYGPPGTGKTFVADLLARFLAGDAKRVTTVQFHPSYSYEDFIEGLRPDPSANGIKYEIRPGAFSDFCDRARADPKNPYVFVIDEINRADLGSVLGELMLLLEYRTKEVDLPYSKRPFSVPENLILLASMNTADRSLALVDFALRRRFHAIHVRPSREVLEMKLAGIEGSDLALAMFDLVQERVTDRNFAPGHSYWLVDDVSSEGLLRVWTYELRPYLSEFWFEHPAKLEELEKEVAGLLADEA